MHYKQSLTMGIDLAHQPALLEQDLVQYTDNKLMHNFRHLLTLLYNAPPIVFRYVDKED